MGRTLGEIIADPLFSEAHVTRIYRVYRIAIPFYAMLALSTALGRLEGDVVMAALWGIQAAFAFGAYVGLLLSPKRAHRVMQIAFGLLVLGMLARIPRSVSVAGLQDVDLHALTVGIVLAQLVGHTLFAPHTARRVNLACATLTSVIAILSLLLLEHPSAMHVFPVVRLIAASATLVALVGFVSDTVHEYGRLWEEHRLMRTLALCDPLTQLPNRRAFEASLAREISRSVREGADLSVIILDVDHFKAINDEFGHDGGDQALLALAQVLRENLRACDEPARWAGDEFVIVLPAADLEQAQLIAERIRRAVAGTLLGVTRCTVTLGVTQFATNQDDVQSLLARADRNLFEAKRKGRNCWVAA